MQQCHLLYPECPPVVKVTQWVDKRTIIDHFFVSKQLSSEVKQELIHLENKKTYNIALLKTIFNNDTIELFENSIHPHFIYESLFLDDSITTVLHKLCIFLDKTATKRVPYIWFKNVMRFNVNNPWSGYHINPFMVDDTPPETANIQYLGEKLFLTNQINILFYEDYKETNTITRSYYFPNDKDILALTANAIKGYSNEQSLLSRLWYKSKSKHENMTKQSTCIYNRATFKGVLNTTDSLKKIFNQLTSNSLCSFIQFVDDLNHVYYKVYKKHRIPANYFDDWINVDKLNGQQQIVIHSFLQEKSLLFAEIRIDSLNNIYISYKLDFSENITYDILESHTQKIKNYLQQFLNFRKPIQLEIENLSLRSSVLLPNANLKSISKFFSSLLPVYNIPVKNRIQKNLFDLQFKRIEKYGQTKNIREYIKSKIALDIPLIDIIIDLEEYGLDEAEVRDYFEELRQEADRPIVERKKRDIRNLGLLMHLSSISFGIQINIDNASSIHDIHNSLFWTRAALIAWEEYEQTTKKKKPTIITPPHVEEEEEEIRPIIPEQKPVSDVSSRSSAESALSFASDEFGGGAVGKEYRRYFNTMLKQIDPNIFSLTKGYATKCQVSDLRQPVGITKEQKAIIDASPYKDGYDNAIEYGSDPNNTNIYMCPRIWCPTSQVPLPASSFDEQTTQCPLEGEKPMLLYNHITWHNDSKTPHYVGFLKEKGHNDVKLPCCFKNLQKEKEKVVKKKTVKPHTDSFRKEDEESYIIDKPKQLADSRIGTIPQSLHEFIYPNVPYQLCKNTVKSNECLLRRGVATTKDSFMNSLAYLLGMDTKEACVKYILKQLNPMLFIQLENGLVYQSFASPSEVLYKKEFSKRKLLHAWLSKYPTYRKLFHIDNWFAKLLDTDNSNISITERYQIIRQLSIYDAYHRYKLYLSNDDEKNPQYFFDLIHHLGMLLVIWNRDNQSLATIKCPYAYKIKQWWMGQKAILPFILILKQDNYYEPLIIVDPSKNITQRIPFTKYQKIETLIQQCPTFVSNDDQILQALYSLQIWVENILLNSNKFTLTKIIIDYNYQIKALMTHGNIWIDLPAPISISSLSYLQQLLPIDEILFWEDIQGKTFDLRIPLSDFKLFSHKVILLGLGLQIGTQRETSSIHMSTLLVIPTLIYKELPKIPLSISNVFSQRISSIQHNNHEWFKVKKYILYELITHYATLVKPNLKTPSKILDSFDKINNPAKVAVLLEELPIHDLSELKKQYDDLILMKPFYQNPIKVHEGRHKKEWVFTQKTIESQDITFIKYPNTLERINTVPSITNETITQVSLPNIDLTTPDMLNEKLCERLSFPTKWRSVVWNEYSIWSLKKYTKTALFDLIEWIAMKNYMSFNRSELYLYTRKRIIDLLTDRKNYPIGFEDLSMRKAWNNTLNRQYRNSNELIENGLGHMSIEDIQKLWMKVLETQSDALWIQDIDLFNISRLLKINFFIIIKGKSVDKKTDELISSCKFICSYNKEEWQYRPLLLLYKEASDDKSHSIYGVITKDKIGYYRQTLECPTELLSLIEKLV